MPEIVVAKNEALERLVKMFRDRLESAFANGQQVRMSAREGTKMRKVSTREFQERSLVDLLSATETDGSFDLHVYIEPKGW